MKNLWLIRHAKSSWNNIDLHDSFRPLNERGYRDAQDMAARLKKAGVNPDLLVSSHAIRAYSTAMIFASVLKFPESNIRIESKLYASNTANYLSVIQSLPDNCNTVFLFAHNPTISQTMELLGGLEHQDLPTTGVAQLTFKNDKWAECAERSGKLMLMDYPKSALE